MCLIESNLAGVVFGQPCAHRRSVRSRGRTKPPILICDQQMCIPACMPGGPVTVGNDL
jgi:hypothetical protein